jgi:hypothetical protein
MTKVLWIRNGMQYTGLLVKELAVDNQLSTVNGKKLLLPVRHVKLKKMHWQTTLYRGCAFGAVELIVSKYSPASIFLQ